MQLHEWIRAELTARGMAEARLGEAEDWTPSQTSRKLRGTYAMTAEEALVALRFLGVPLPQTIAAGANDTRSLIQRLGAAASRLDVDDLAHITALAERLAGRPGSSSR